MISDLLYVVRTLLRNRIFALVTVLTLALGIGSATAIFSVTDWILFQANKFPNDVVLIGGKSSESQLMPIRMDFMARSYAESTNVMSEYAKASYQSGNIVVDGQPVATSWIGVSANLFPMLGVKMTKGRAFAPGEDVEGNDRAVIVSEAFWKGKLAGREDVLGTKILVGDAVCTVVGVVRATAMLPAYLMNDVYRPLTYRVDPATPWMPNLFLFARIRQGITRAQAAEALDKVKVDIPPSMRPFLENDRPVLSSMSELNQVFRIEIYWVMLGAVGFLYAIACLNASNLILVRLLGRRRELCLRLALGCGRWRLVRLMALETLVLAVLGSLVGYAVANIVFPLLLAAADSGAGKSMWEGGGLGWRVAGFMALLTLATSLLIVVVPAVRVFRTDIYAGLKDGGAALGESPALARLRGLFVVLQAAFAVVLLVGAGLMIQTFQRLQKIDVGFDPERRAKINLNFPADYPNGNEVRIARLYEIRDFLKKIPGVTGAGFGNDMLLPGYYFASWSLAGPEGKTLRAAFSSFNIGYNEAAGVRLKRGRWLDKRNGNEVMVNEAFARACWPDQDPVGQFLRPTDGNPSAGAEWKGWNVVGVVGDFRSSLRDAPGLFVFGPEGWSPAGPISFIVKLSQELDDAFAGKLRKDLYAFDPRIIVELVMPLNGLRDNQLWAERMANSVLKVLASIALLLTVVGIFSVLAYTVDQRMPEFGVRMALGATRGQLMGLVLRKGVLLAAAGVVTGIAGSLAMTRFLQSLLYETSAQDPWVLVAVGAILLAVSVVACALPAFRATKVDITRLLRAE